MVIITVEFGGKGGVGIERVLAKDVAVSSANVEDSGGRECPVLNIGEEIAEAAHVVVDVGIVGDVAEILRRIVVDDVSVVGGGAGGIGGLMVIALLIPCPVRGGCSVACDLLDVSLYIEKIERGVVVGGGGLFDIGTHERERQRGECEIWRWLASGVAGGVGLFERRPGRRLRLSGLISFGVEQ